MPNIELYRFHDDAYVQYKDLNIGEFFQHADYSHIKIPGTYDNSNAIQLITGETKNFLGNVRVEKLIKPYKLVITF